MWQLLLAAAVAGSTSLVAKHFLGHDPSAKEEQSPFSQVPIDGFSSAFADSNECGHELQGGGVFRFSSSGESSGRKKTRILKKKSGINGRRLKFGGHNHNDGMKFGDPEGIPKRFAFCLKKRRTSIPNKCRSPSSKDGYLFGWGLGVGMLYMMSAGKAEISKLSMAMEETSKVVHELKNELCKRKSAQIECNDIIVPGVLVTDEIECPSSVLTEEAEPQVVEMDQLEAELATELQKLPLGAYIAENDESPSGIHGVLASELDQKLCHVLIEQQENQIEELESQLHSAQSKLCEKEAQLQALKDCVRRLSEFSLSNVSDDEADIQTEQDCFSEWDNSSYKMESESAPMISTVGMKRSINSA